MHFYWTVIRKRKWIIVATTILVTVLSFAYTNRKTRIYQATATVIIDPQAPKVLGTQMQDVVELGANGVLGNEDYYNTQFHIIHSRSLAEEVVKRYGLDSDPRIVGANPTDSEEELNARATAYVEGSIRVLPIKDSRVVGISVRDPSPELAQELANHVATVFIDRNLQVKRSETIDASKWVAEKLDKAKVDLHASETALYDFKRKNNILSVALEDRQNMTTKALEQFHDALTDTHKKRIDLQARRRAVARLINTDSVDIPSSYVSESAGIEQARRNYRDEAQKLAQLQKRYGPKHPEVQYQEERTTAARDALKAEGLTLLRSLDGEIKADLDAEANYTKEVERLTEEALVLNKQEIDYKRLSRDSQNNSDIYALLLKRAQESGLQAQDTSNNIRPLDSALRPASPIEPNLRSSVVLGFALGLMLALALAFFVEFMDRSVKSQEDIEVNIGLPFLGFVPSVDLGTISERRPRDLYILEHPNSTVAECCRVVRTNILFCSPDKPLKTLVVTSSNPVEGKTMTVVNLGIVMAQSGHSTLIVDTDMRRPRLHKALGVSNENGVSRLIVGETDIDSAVKSTDVPGLYLLPCGPIPPNPAELIQTEKFAAMAKKLSERFDRVIFDSPPVMAVTDAAVLSRVVDAAVIVVRAGRTPRDSVVRAKQLIRAVNPNIIGVVLNDVNLKNPHYANYYQYYQYKYHNNPATIAAVAAAAKGDNET